MLTLTQDKDRRAVAYWLLGVAALVFLMVVVGGATRLTGSGLSMVDWRPVTGVLPPLTEAAWQAEFAQYQESPEYKLVNMGMTLEAFKGIFYWEWGHRLLGRIIGLAFAVPLLVFWLGKKVPAGYLPRLVGLFFLGGSQGLLGWYMVQSGLVDEPAVSHYRLTAHLSLALVIYSALVWTALGLLVERSNSQAADRSLRRLGVALVALTGLQIAMGALVAGLKAGHVYNTWPLMDGRVVPEGVWSMEPAWRNLFDNAALVQFDHRIGAYILFALTLWAAYKVRSAARPLRIAGLTAACVVLAQMLLGIVTLLADVPVSLGTLHQAGGVLVLTSSLVYLFLAGRKGGRDLYD